MQRVSQRRDARVPSLRCLAARSAAASVSERQAYQSAEATALNILASVKQRLGGLDRVRRVVKLTGMVNSAPGFQRQFAVLDGASDVLCALFGPEAGQHARSAVGIFELPRGFCMENEVIFEVEP